MQQTTFGEPETMNCRSSVLADSPNPGHSGLNTPLVIHAIQPDRNLVPVKPEGPVGLVRFLKHCFYDTSEDFYVK